MRRDAKRQRQLLQRTLLDEAPPEVVEIIARKLSSCPDYEHWVSYLSHADVETAVHGPNALSQALCGMIRGVRNEGMAEEDDIHGVGPAGGWLCVSRNHCSSLLYYSLAAKLTHLALRAASQTSVFWIKRCTELQELILHDIPHCNWESALGSVLQVSKKSLRRLELRGSVMSLGLMRDLQNHGAGLDVLSLCFFAYGEGVTKLLCSVGSSLRKLKFGFFKSRPKTINGGNLIDFKPLSKVCRLDVLSVPSPLLYQAAWAMSKTLKVFEIKTSDVTSHQLKYVLLHYPTIRVDASMSENVLLYLRLLGTHLRRLTLELNSNYSGIIEAIRMCTKVEWVTFKGRGYSSSLALFGLLHDGFAPKEICSLERLYYLVTPEPSSMGIYDDRTNSFYFLSKYAKSLEVLEFNADDTSLPTFDVVAAKNHTLRKVSVRVHAPYHRGKSNDVFAEQHHAVVAASNFVSAFLKCPRIESISLTDARLPNRWPGSYFRCRAEHGKPVAVTINNVTYTTAEHKFQ